jgi:nucleoid-associated protein YgaU
MSDSAVQTRSELVRKGRHRKPSTTGQTIAKTVVAGAVVGTPLTAVTTLTTPGTAHAASDTVWDRVAKCESGGNWSINTGNGFKGGLQFTSSTWRGFGGTQFANSAEKATREQQIVVAEKVLSKQGWGAWPVCSRKAKATGHPATLRTTATKPKSATGSTAVTTKAIGTKKDAKPSPVAAFAGRHALKPAGPNPLVTAPPAVTGQPALAPGAPAPTPVVQVADRLKPLLAPAAPAPPQPLSALPLSPAPAASGPATPAPRIPTPRTSPENMTAAPAPIPVAERTYQVRAGDTLVGIARAQGVAGGWKAIYEANRAALPDANHIRPGQELKLS